MRNSKRKICAILIFPFRPNPPCQIKDKKKIEGGKYERERENGKQGSIFRGGRAESNEKEDIEKFFVSFVHAAKNVSFFWKFLFRFQDWSLRKLNSHDMWNEGLWWVVRECNRTDSMVAQILICLKDFFVNEKNLRLQKRRFW